MFRSLKYTNNWDILIKIFYKELVQFFCKKAVLRLVNAVYHTANVTAFVDAFYPINHVSVCRAKQNVSSNHKEMRQMLHGTGIIA